MHKQKPEHSSSTLLNNYQHQQNEIFDKNLEEKLKELNILKFNKSKTKRHRNDYNLTRILNWNIEGFENAIKNSAETNLFRDTDLIILTETFDTDDRLHIPGYYKIFVSAEKQEKGRPTGGIAIIYKPHIRLQEVSKSQNKIHAISPLGHILAYYYNPNTNIEDIIEEITNDVSNLDAQPCIIGGDFNCRIDILLCSKGIRPFWI